MLCLFLIVLTVLILTFFIFYFQASSNTVNISEADKEVPAEAVLVPEEGVLQDAPVGVDYYEADKEVPAEGVLVPEEGVLVPEDGVANNSQPQTRCELERWIKEYCEGIKDHGEPNTWDVTLITDMGTLFMKNETFNEPINLWDVSRVTNMSGMFAENIVFNQPLDEWNISSVEDMSFMFACTSVFNQPLNSWDIADGTDTDEIFCDAEAMEEANKPKLK